MNRRKLLKALTALPMIPVFAKGKEVGKAVKVDPNAKYVVFLNPSMVEIKSFCEYGGFPSGTPVYTVFPHNGPGGTMDDIIRAYKV